MNKKKNQMKQILYVAVMVFLFAFTGGKAKAAAAPTVPIADNDENGEQKGAATIELNKAYAGETRVQGDVDWYRFVIPEGTQGYFQASIKPDANADSQSINGGWTLAIYKEGEQSSLVWLDYCNTASSQPMPFSPGVYYLFVKNSRDTSWNNGIPEEYYNIKVDYIQDAHWEREYNNKISTASVINVNEQYSGNLTYQGDSDWYCFTIPQSGKVVLDFGPEISVVTTVGNGWNLRMYKEGVADVFTGANKVVQKMTTFNMYLEAGTYYLNIYENYHLASPVGKEYNLKVNYSAGGNNEAEYNNTMATANLVQIGTTYTGNLYYDWSGLDVDYFKFVPAKSGYISMDFTRDLASSVGEGFKVRFIDSSSKEVSKKEKIKDASATIDSVPVTKGQTYYIEISNQSKYGTINGVDYHFALSLSEADPNKQKETTEQDNVAKQQAAFQKTTATGVSVKSTSKKKATIKWAKTNGASGYKIYRSTKRTSGYKCIKTITKGSTISFKDTKVKSKKTYYYMVRAYKKFGSKTVYGKFSAIKKVKVK